MDFIEVLPGCLVPSHGIAMVRFAVDDPRTVEVAVATPSAILGHRHTFDNVEAAQAWMKRIAG